MATSKTTSKKIIDRQRKQKEVLVDQFKKLPIVQVACEKTGVSRATYYRWCKDDKDFQKKADEAIAEGVSLVNDMAESQIISLMKDRNLRANIFWLKHRHRAYKTRVEVSGKLETNVENLTPEQEQVVREALKLAGLSGSNEESDSPSKSITP